MERTSNVECGELLSIAPRDVDSINDLGSILRVQVCLGSPLDDILKMVPWKDLGDTIKLVIVLRQ
jgi:hypothetical protein